MFSGQRLWIETAPGVSTFNIADTREDDEGDYSILLRNVAGTSEHKFKLQVDTLPEINRPDRYTSVLVYDEGETVKLRLTFSEVGALIFITVQHRLNGEFLPALVELSLFGLLFVLSHFDEIVDDDCDRQG
ncbi:unnamed protein product [Cylicostephanus goldi]|uniref:Immunoglobulin I-set domain-containing protein n=1 Tax=Cylicostephanus goldi TaxID=71465 RepID=A0A3P6QKY5_CYLGO|nr:unnamed protein product [Cylicostephanus goldi]